MVRYQEVPAQNVVLYYVLMEFGNRTCAYLYQVADVLAVVLVRVVPVLITKIQYRVVFEKIVHTKYTRVHRYEGTRERVPVYRLPEQPYFRIRTELYCLPTFSGYEFVRHGTAGTSGVLAFVLLPCIPVVSPTASQYMVRVSASQSRVRTSARMLVSRIGNA